MIEEAMKGSLLVVSVYEDNRLIGIGRVIGDGGITFAITDIMVDKGFQRKGIADQIMLRIDKWLDENTDSGCFIMLHATVPADKLYLKHGFNYIEPQMIGMLRNQT